MALEEFCHTLMSSAAFIYIAGYGPLLCACTFVSHIKELRHAEMKWDKTEKTGKVAMPV